MPAMTSLLFALPTIGGLIYLFGAARVWRLNRAVAALMVVLWPIGVYALFKYWGERKGGPRALLLSAFAAFAACGALLGWNLAHVPQPVSADMDGLDVPTDVVDSDGVAGRAKRAMAIAKLRRRTGSVDIPDVPVSIDVPVHFRFIDRAALLNAFAGGDDEPGDNTVGWLVHERVDLSSDQAWHVEVGYLGDGYVASNDFAATGGDALLARAQDAARKLADGEDGAQLQRFAEAPTFDPAAARVNWVEELSLPGRASPMLACHAVQLGRKGAVLFSIAGADATRQELCLRSVRMLAAHAHFGPGQTYADHSRTLDRNAPYVLADLVAGAYLEDR